VLRIRAFRLPWRKRAKAPPESLTLLQAALLRELALHDEDAATRLADEAKVLRSSAEPAAALAALEQAAETRAQEVERERERADERVIAGLSREAERLAAEAAAAHSATHEELEKTLRAALRDEAERLRAEYESEFANHARAIENAAEKRARRSESRRAEDTKALLSNIADRLSKHNAKRLGEEARVLVKSADEWKIAAEARLAEVSSREIQERVATSEKRLAAELADHLMLLERAGEQRVAEIKTGIDERFSAALADHEAEVGRVREAAETQLAEHVGALKRAGEGRTEKAEARIARSRDRLERLAGELESHLAEADREAERASEEAERYMRQIRNRAKRTVRKRGDAALQTRTLPIEANEATLEDLRTLGMSLTQATRMLRFRDSLGGFSAIEQLEDVPGLSVELRGELKRWLTVSADAGASRRPFSRRRRARSLVAVADRDVP
jgi:DNA uptake protein ComE-like DNA-binding protein